MQAKGNVVEIMERIRKKSSKTPPLKDGAVLDMTVRRNEILDQERRQVKRTILTEFVGAVVVIPGQGLLKVAMYDVSDNGLAFEYPSHLGHFRDGEEVAMRVYLNHKSYFPFVIRIVNSRLISEESVYRTGGQFVKGTINDQALEHFVKFIESVSASLETDSGDVMVSNLTDR